MFENLQTKLNAVFDWLATRGKLTEQDVDVALREVAPGAAGKRTSLQGRQGPDGALSASALFGAGS